MNLNKSIDGVIYKSIELSVDSSVNFYIWDSIRKPLLNYTDNIKYPIKTIIKNKLR